MKWIPLAAGLLAASLATTAQATAWSENFDNLATSGWTLTNASSPVGQSWFQGNSGIFAAQAGADDAYAAANFSSTTSVTGKVDNWLISPALSIDAGSMLSFFTRAGDAGFSDVLEVRFSSSGGSAVADFSTLVATIGSADLFSYPTDSWVAYSFALPDAASGRIAFRYVGADASNLSYVGVDTVSVSAVPEPASLALLGLGLGCIALRRSQRSSN